MLHFPKGLFSRSAPLLCQSDRATTNHVIASRRPKIVEREGRFAGNLSGRHATNAALTFFLPLFWNEKVCKDIRKQSDYVVNIEKICTRQQNELSFFFCLPILTYGLAIF